MRQWRANSSSPALPGFGRHRLAAAVVFLAMTLPAFRSRVLNGVWPSAAPLITWAKCIESQRSALEAGTHRPQSTHRWSSNLHSLALTASSRQARVRRERMSSSARVTRTGAVTVDTLRAMLPRQTLRADLALKLAALACRSGQRLSPRLRSHAHRHSLRAVVAQGHADPRMISALIELQLKVVREKRH